jgi:BirA family biotin operon repressor/biotin-[acetyl-CoA-carboxylase] ligase
MTFASSPSYLSRKEQFLFSSNKIDVIHLNKTVGSTQEEAKRLIMKRKQQESDGANNRALAVIADDQSKGRGTSGRSWVASKGNLYLTCAFLMDRIPMSKITLLPLGCGIVIAEEIVSYSETRPTLKWPNDVLLDRMKVAGTLIENFQIESQYWWLIGIGVNVKSHPDSLPKEKEDVREKPRSATSLQRHSEQSATIPSAPVLGLNIAGKLNSWVEVLQSRDAASIVESWKSFADFDTPYVLRTTGEIVIIKDIQTDGRLKVVGEDGEERLLVADYFH